MVFLRSMLGPVFGRFMLEVFIMVDAEMKLRMVEKGFYEVPEFMHTEEIKRAVNELFNGKAYVCSNPKGSISLFSEDGILLELARG